MDIVTIGLIYDMTNPEDMVALEGWHVDSIQQILGAEAFLTKPATPRHVFAGVSNEDVYRYRFESEKQATLFLGTDHDIT